MPQRPQSPPSPEDLLRAVQADPTLLDRLTESGRAQLEEMASQAERPSAASRIGGGLWEETLGGLGAIGGAALGGARNMAESAMEGDIGGVVGPPMRGAGTVASGIYEGSKEQLEKGATAFEQRAREARGASSPAEAALRYGAGGAEAFGRTAMALPVLGPVMASMMEQATGFQGTGSGQQEQPDVAGAFGRGLGMAATEAIAPGFRSLRRGVTGGPRAAVGSALADVPRTPGSYFGGAMGRSFRSFEDFVSRLSGGGKLQAFRVGTQQKYINDLVQGVYDRISRFDGEPEDFAQYMQESIDTGRKELRRQGSEIYQAIDELVPEPIIDVRPLKQWAEEEIQRLNRDPLHNPAKMEETMDVLERLATTPEDFWNFSTAQAARRGARQRMTNLMDPNPDVNRAINQQIAGRMTTQIDDAAKQVPQFEAMLNDASDMWRRSEDAFDKSMLKRIANARDPEAIAAMLPKMTGRDMRLMKDMLSEANASELWDTARRDYIRENIFGPATRRSQKFQLAGSDVLSEELGEIFSGAEIRKRLAEMPAARRRELFSAEEINTIEDIARASDKVTGGAGSEAAASLAAGGLNIALLPALASLSQKAITAVGIPMALGAAYAKAVTSPTLRSSVRGWAKAVDNGQFGMAANIATRLGNELFTDEEREQLEQMVQQAQAYMEQQRGPGRQ